MLLLRFLTIGGSPRNYETIRECSRNYSLLTLCYLCCLYIVNLLLRFFFPETAFFCFILFCFWKSYPTSNLRFQGITKESTLITDHTWSIQGRACDPSQADQSSLLGYFNSEPRLKGGSLWWGSCKNESSTWSHVPHHVNEADLKEWSTNAVRNWQKRRDLREILNNIVPQALMYPYFLRMWGCPSVS